MQELIINRTYSETGVPVGTSELIQDRTYQIQDLSDT